MRIAPLALIALALAACNRDDHSAGRQFPLSPSATSSTAAIGQVYTTTNSAAGNAVLVFDRAGDGSLSPAGSFLTGGLGTGAGLGSQGALALDEAGRNLVVVNAGSDELTSFHIDADGTPVPVTTIGSGGTTPKSVTISNGLVYALNAGGAGNIAAFRLTPAGVLTAIPGSSRPLSSTSSDPAQIAFDPTGRLLVVTEKATNVISTYSVDASGLATGPVVTASSGQTPFGFGFTQSGTLVVSEAFGGAIDGSAVSSYQGSNGTWLAISPSVPTTETAACWIAVTNSGLFAYAANTGSNSITGYRIEQGTLTRLDANGVTASVGMSDMSVSRDSRFLYAVANGPHVIAAYGIGADGSLTAVQGASGLPAGIVGLVAR